MKLPRGLTGAELVRSLQRLGYTVTRQTGSHIRLTCAQPFEHISPSRITILCE